MDNIKVFTNSDGELCAEISNKTVNDELLADLNIEDLNLILNSCRIKGLPENKSIATYNFNDCEFIEAITIPKGTAEPEYLGIELDTCRGIMPKLPKVFYKLIMFDNNFDKFEIDDFKVSVLHTTDLNILKHAKPVSLYLIGDGLELDVSQVSSATRLTILDDELKELPDLTECKKLRHLELECEALVRLPKLPENLKSLKITANEYYQTNPEMHLPFIDGMITIVMK